MLWRQFHRRGKLGGAGGSDEAASVWLEDHSGRDLLKLSVNDWLNPFHVRWRVPPHLTGEDFPTRGKALARFEVKVKELLAKGWVETEPSMTRRLFGHPAARKPTKFWAASLDGRTLIVQFGRVRPGSSHSSGQRKENAFASPEAARAAYDKLVVEKTGSGYKEMWKRPKPAAGAGRARPTEDARRRMTGKKTGQKHT